MGTMRPNKYDVVISGALCTVEDYVIMSQCAHNKAIHVAAEGTVSVTDISQTQNITIVGLPDYVNNNFKIALYAKETQRYVCFNENWKLVGMKELRDTCYFNETIVHGYFVFRSAVDLQRRVGFTHRGKAVGPKKNVNDACYMFTKIQADQFFHQHTDYFAPKPHATATTTTLSSSLPSSTRVAFTTATTANRSKLPRNKNKRINGMRNNNNNHSNNNQNQQQYTNGHSSNISASNSSRSGGSSSSNISLSNAKQQLGLSAAKYHNGSSNNTREHVRQQQQQHLVRHHHNDPNVVARRQQHEHKQKRRQRNRLRGATSLTNTTTTTTTRTATTTVRARKIQTPTTFYSSTVQVLPLSKTTATTTTATSKAKAATQSKTFTTTQTAFSATAAATASRYKQHSTAATNAADNGSMATWATAAAKVKSLTTTATTTTTNKRKGRRRKGRKHLSQQQRNRLLSLKSQPQVARSNVVATSTPAATVAAETAPSATAYASSTTFDDVAASSSSSVAGDYPYDSSEWLSSVEPFESSPASPTSVTFDAFSLSSTSETDVAAASLFPTAANDYNNNQTSVEVTDADLSSEIETNATTFGSNMSTQSATMHANSIISEREQQQLYSTAATYSLSDKWSPATFYDELETTVNGEPLLAPTPTLAHSVRGNAFDVGHTQAAAAETEWPATYGNDDNWQSSVADDEYATTTSSNDTVTVTDADADADTDNDNNTDSSSSTSAADFSSEAAQFMESVATDTADTTLTATDDIVADASENMISVSNMAKSSRATTVATLHTTKQQTNEYSNNLKATAATTVAQTMTDSSSTTWSTNASSSSSSAGNLAAIDLTEFIYSTRSSNFHKNNRHRNVGNNNNNNDEDEQQRHTVGETSNNFSKKYLGEGSVMSAKLNRHANKMYSNLLPTIPTATATGTVQHARNTATATTIGAAIEATASTNFTTTSTAKAATTTVSNMPPYASNVAASTNSNQSNLLSVNKNINHSHNNNTIAEAHSDNNNNGGRKQQQLLHTPSTTLATATATVRATAPSVATATTKKSIRISTQRLLATPFHQLTYVRNNAGDIDIDNIDNISVYPDLLEEQALAEAAADTNRADLVARSHSSSGGNSRLTMVSGYLPTSATAVLPESIRIAKIKINKERKRMMTLRQRHFGSYA